MKPKPKPKTNERLVTWGLVGSSYALPSPSGRVRHSSRPEGTGDPSAASGGRKGFFTADYRVFGDPQGGFQRWNFLK
jgi:hypothetical protein